MDRSSKQRINEDIVMLHNTLYETDLTDIYRTLQPKEVKYKFFSNAHGTLSKIEQIIGHKTSLNKFNKIENHIKHLLESQWLEPRNQPQGKNSKTLKYTESE